MTLFFRLPGDKGKRKSSALSGKKRKTLYDRACRAEAGPLLAGLRRRVPPW
jgi:hypothetical protein